MASAHLALPTDAPLPTVADYIQAFKACSDEQIGEIREKLFGSVKREVEWLRGRIREHTAPPSADAKRSFPVTRDDELDTYPDYVTDFRERKPSDTSAESWDAEMEVIASALNRDGWIPTPRTRTALLTMAYAILTCQPYRYLRDFQGVPEHLRNKKALMREIQEIQWDEEYMEQWDHWVCEQSQGGCLPFEI